MRKGRTKVAKLFLDWWLKTKGDFEELKYKALLDVAEGSGKCTSPCMATSTDQINRKA